MFHVISVGQKLTLVNSLIRLPLQLLINFRLKFVIVVSLLSESIMDMITAYVCKGS